MTVNELRLDVGMSQSQFANHFGIPLRTYQKWEIGPFGLSGEVDT